MTTPGPPPAVAGQLHSRSQELFFLSLCPLQPGCADVHHQAGVIFLPLDSGLGQQNVVQVTVCQYQV
jgi:hypothetical protein